MNEADSLNLAAIDADERATVAMHALDIQAVMNTPEGRRLVWRILDAAGVMRLSFDAARPDPCVTAFREGQREIGVRLWSELTTYAAEQQALMVRESNLLRGAIPSA